MVKFKLETYMSSLYHNCSGVRAGGGGGGGGGGASPGLAGSPKVIQYPCITQKTEGLGESLCYLEWKKYEIKTDTYFGMEKV